MSNSPYSPDEATANQFDFKIAEAMEQTGQSPAELRESFTRISANSGLSENNPAKSKLFAAIDRAESRMGSVKGRELLRSVNELGLPTNAVTKADKVAEVTSTKESKLSQAVVTKEQRLAEISRPTYLEDQSNKIVAERARLAEINDRALVKNTRLDTYAGAVANSTVAAVQGTANVVGNIAGLEDNKEANRLLNKLSDPARAALTKLNRGEKLTLAERAELAKKVDIGKPSTPHKFSTTVNYQPEMVSNLEIYERFNKSLDNAELAKKFLTEDTAVSKAFNPLNREKLMKGLGDDWEAGIERVMDAEGVFENTGAVAGLIGDAIGNLANNPSATTEFAAESLINVPLSVNPATAAINTTAYSSDLLANLIRKRKEKNNGEVINKEDQAEISENATAAGAAEYVGNVLTASVAGLKGLGGAAKETTKETAKKSLLGAVAKRPAKVAGSSAGEAVTEGYQTGVENDVLNKDFDIAKDGKDIYAGAAIGAGASGVTTAPSQTLATAGDVGSAVIDQAADKVAKQTKKVNGYVDKLDKSLETGDMSTYILAPENDGKESNESYAEKLRVIANKHNELAGKDKDEKAAGTMLKAYSQAMNVLVDKKITLLEKLEKEQNPKERQKLGKEISDIDAVLERNDFEKMKAKQQSLVKTPEVVERVVQSKERDESFEIDAQRIFDTNEVNPEAFTVEQLSSILTSDKWTQAERQVLESAVQVREAKEELNSFVPSKSMAKVHGEVVRGRFPTKGSKHTIVGGDQYRSAIVGALQNKDFSKAKEVLANLTAFTKRHSGKSEALTKAFAPYAEKRPLTEEDKAAEAFAVERYGVDYVKQQSAKLVESVKLEADTLQALVSEAESMITAYESAPETKAETVTEPEVNTTQETTPNEVSDPVVENTDNQPSTEENTVEGDTGAPVNNPTTVSENTNESPATQEPQLNSKTGAMKSLSTKLDNLGKTEVTTDEQQIQLENDFSDLLNQLVKLVEDYDVSNLPEVFSEAKEEILEVFPVTHNTDLVTDWIKDIEQNKANTKDMFGNPEPLPQEEGSVDSVVTEEQPTTETATGESAQVDVNEATVTSEEPAPVTEGKFRPFATMLEALKGTKFGRWFQAVNPAGLLGSAPNIIQELINNPEIVAELTKNGELTNEQKAAIKNFTQFYKTFAARLNELSPKIAAEYAHNDMHSALGLDGTLNDSALAVMAGIAYNWIAFESKSSIYSDPKTIAKMLGLSNKDQLTDKQIAIFSTAGTDRRKLAEGMGQEISKSLGITYNSSTTNKNKERELHTALGNFVVGTMNDLGLVSLNYNENGKQKFSTVKANFKLDPNGREVLSDNIQRMVDVNTNTDRIASLIISPDKAALAPTFKPVTKVASKYKNTVRSISGKLHNLILKAQAKPWIVSNDTHRMLDNYTQEEQYQIYGIVGEEDIKDSSGKVIRVGLQNMTEANRVKQLAKNAALIREADNYSDFTNTLNSSDAGLSKPFYFSYSVWKNLRAGIKNTLINPQTSKLHRGLVGLKAWKTRVRLDDRTKLDNFLYGIAQGIDFKVEVEGQKLGADKLTMPTLLAALTEELNISELDGKTKIPENIKTSIFVDAAKAITLFNEGFAFKTEADEIKAKQNIIDAVIKGGEGTHTLLALTNLGRYLSAKHAKEVKGENITSFESDLWIELDGITNGPAIGLIQFGNTALKSLLEKAGIYTDSRRSNGEFKEEGQDDMYETLGKHWSNGFRPYINNLKSNGDKETLRSLEAVRGIVGQIGRSLSKNPLMTNAYGSGVQAILDKFGQEVVDALNSKIEKIVNSDKTTSEKNSELAALNRELFYITGVKNTLPLNGDPRHLLTKSGALSDSMVERIILRSGNLYRQPLEDAMYTMLSEFKDNRAEYNKAMQKMNNAFVLAYEQMYATKEKELTEAGTLKPGDYLPQDDIDKIVEVLQPMLPTTRVVFGDKDTEQLQSNKTELVVKGSKKTRTSFSRKLNNSGRKTVANLSSETIFSPEVRVGPSIQFIHSFDASIALDTFTEFDVLNVFDGFPVSVNDVAKVSTALNQSMFKHLNERNVYGELNTSINRAMEVYLALSEDKSNFLFKDKNIVKALVEGADIANSMDRKTAEQRKEFLDSVEHVNHYSFEGAGYETPHGKAQREAREVGPSKEVIPDPVFTENVWGKFNPDKGRTSDEFVIAFEDAILAQKRPVSAKKFLTDFIKKAPKSKRTEMLKQVIPLIKDDVKLDVISENTPYDEGIGVLRGALGGWSPKRRTVYLKTSDYKESGTTAETVTHEFIHAITSDAINAVNSGKMKNKVVVQAVKELESLLSQVKKQLGRDVPHSIRYGALSNTKEFIAYGLTHPEFHNTLKGMEVKPLGKITNALTQFAELVTRIIFGKVSPSKTNALAQLIELTGVIAEQGTEPSVVYEDNIDAQKIERMTSQEILSHLPSGNRTAEHQEHIANLQAALINSIEGVHGVDLFDAEQNIGDEVDTYLDNLLNNKKTFTGTLHRLFNLTPQEAYLAEQMEAVFEADLVGSSYETEQLGWLWEQAKALPVTAFLDHPSQASDPRAMRIAAARRKHLFHVNSNKVEVDLDNANAGKAIVYSKSDYLKRFAIVASTHAPLRAELVKLSVKSKASSKVENSYLKQLAMAVERVIERIRTLFLRTSRLDGSMAKQLDTVLENVATTNRRRRRRHNKGPNRLRGTADVMDSSIKNIFDKLGNALNVSNAKDSENTYVALAGNLIDTVANDRSNKVIDAIYQVTDKLTASRHSLVLNLVEELRGETPNNSTLMKILRFANRDNEQKRRFVKERIGKIIEDSFAKKPEEHEQKALTKVLVQGDLESLLSEFGLDGIDTLLSDEVALNKAISKAENDLKSLTEYDYYANMAEALGKYMVTGQSTKGFKKMPKSALGIARMPGTGVEVDPKIVKQATPLIDTLASLHSINAMAASDKTIIVEMMRTEKNREDGGNGVEFTMLQHRALKKEALAKNFAGAESMMAKGYTYEITNPYITLEWAAEGSPEALALEAKGFTKAMDTKRDKDDPEQQTASLYISEDGGMMQYLTGIVSFTGKGAKGKRFEKAASDVGNQGIGVTFTGDLAQLNTKADAEVKNLLNKRVHAMDIKDTGLLAVFSPEGVATDFRYEMSEGARDYHLQKNYAIGDVLGGTAGSIIDKSSTEGINNQVIDALHDQFDNDTTSAQDTYVMVGSNAKDPELRQIWAMLPYEAKQHAISKFGQPGIMIRKEHMNLVFGYRKKSLGDLWDGRFDGVRIREQLKDGEYNAMVQHAFKWALEATLGKVYGAKLANKIKYAEDVHQTLIRAVKDIFVVKNIFTTVGNIVSNTALLRLAGVPFTDIIRDQAIAWRAAQKYNEHKKELFKLENLMETTNPTGQARKDTLSRIGEIRHKMANNPVHELMEAGMFQTIVEDIDATIDPYSYKSKFLKDLDKRVGSKIPKNAKTFGKYLFITQDTKLYKMLNHPIQMSDFAARYTQFKYLTETQSDKMSKDDAFKKITENFINYDVPTNKGLQYLNDMGFIMFTKYLLRIQKPVFNLFRDRPATAMMGLLAQDLLGFTSPFDSSVTQTDVLGRFSNPWNSMINAPDDIASMNALAHVAGIK